MGSTVLNLLGTAESAVILRAALTAVMPKLYDLKLLETLLLKKLHYITECT